MRHDKEDNPVAPKDLSDIKESVTIKPIFYFNITFDTNGGTVRGGESYTARLDRIRHRNRKEASSNDLVSFFLH